MPEMLNFEAPKDQSSIIKVIGVGGGGSNAVNHMYEQGIRGVDFIVSNTDAQALEKSPVPVKVQLGSSLTEGRGAGSLPEVGKNAAIENIEDLKEILNTNTKMVFITAGMGGGTGTGGAPVIAETAREMDILTVGIVTIPFGFEGRKRKQQAELGIQELRQHVDTLLVINNEKLRELYGNLSLSEAFSKADNVLTTAAKGIAEIITVVGHVNVDFADVQTVMKNSGVAIMGSGMAEGEDRALKAAQEALSSPLLNDSQIKGASNVLLYISSGTNEIQMDEVSEITDYIQFEAGNEADIIWGTGQDPELGDNISITLIATGFETGRKPGGIINTAGQQQESIKHDLQKVMIEDEKKIADEAAGMSLINRSQPETFNTQQPKPEVEPEVSASTEVDDDLLNFTIVNKSTEDNQGALSSEFDARKISVRQLEEEEQLEQNVEEQDFVREDEFSLRRQERINRLRERSIKIKSQEGLQELENEPAYKRNNVTLEDVTPASESEISRYSLGDNDDEAELTGNSFLHDNVD